MKEDSKSKKNRSGKMHGGPGMILLDPFGMKKEDLQKKF
jgi:hypothetical protein